MTTPTSPSSQFRRRRRRSSSSSYESAAYWFAVAAFVVSAATVESYYSSPTLAAILPARIETRRFFRNDYLQHLSDPTSSVQSSTLHNLIQTQTSTSNGPASSASLPTWLALPRSHLVESNLEMLTRAMQTASVFSDAEIAKVKSALTGASQGDAQKLAGAAEFVTLLVHFCDVGLNALVAAAFHYAACVTARENGTANNTISPSSDPSDDDVMSITRDARRLKALEMVAAATVASHSKKGTAVNGKADAENLCKLLLAESKDWRALAIRSTACLFRLHGLLQSGMTELTPEAVRVGKEALEIYAPLASRLGMHRLKNELEDAAFRVLYRRQYQKINTLARQIRLTSQAAETSSDSNNGRITEQSMGHVLVNVQKEMTDMLASDAEFTAQVEDFTVTARVKEPFSLWKKMLRHGYKDILQVPDAMALRIVLQAKKLTDDEPLAVTRARERALCYYAQQLCMEQWKPDTEPRLKDYIDRPKSNGYQSLHYTAVTHDKTGRPWTMEIQIRSSEMHSIAENGLASHVDYKSAQYKRGKQVRILRDGSSDAYLRSLQEWRWKQHGSVTVVSEDSAPTVTTEPDTMSDMLESRIRADRIRARTQRLQPYLQALTAAQSDLTREFVFVFVQQEATTSEDESPLGKVLALPTGACVLDAVRASELHLARVNDHRCTLNGSVTSMTSRLSNGDVLTLPRLSHLAM